MLRGLFTISWVTKHSTNVSRHLSDVEQMGRNRRKWCHSSLPSLSHVTTVTKAFWSWCFHYFKANLNTAYSCFSLVVSQLQLCQCTTVPSTGERWRISFPFWAGNASYSSMSPIGCRKKRILGSSSAAALIYNDKIIITSSRSKPYSLEKKHPKKNYSISKEQHSPIPPQY